MLSACISTIVRRVYNNMMLRQAIEIRGALPAKHATKQELRQLVEKGCFRPIDKSEINSLHESRQRILPSKLFLKDKHKPDGTFLLKARLVAGGHKHDHENYDTVSSPIVSTAAMFTVAAISAKEGRHRMTTDVPAAYINAKMDPSMPKSICAWTLPIRHS
jgi:hypothetical protein